MRILLAALAFSFATAAQAQTFPSRPVTIIIPYPPAA
jgi:tripartite-type tricarboxylate transporter receptor subunit TctC